MTRILLHDVYFFQVYIGRKKLSLQNKNEVWHQVWHQSSATSSATMLVRTNLHNQIKKVKKKQKFVQICDPKPL
jgi:hypothetical protein